MHFAFAALEFESNADTCSLAWLVLMVKHHGLALRAEMVLWILRCPHTGTQTHWDTLRHRYWGTDTGTQTLGHRHWDRRQ